MKYQIIQQLIIYLLCVVIGMLTPISGTYANNVQITNVSYNVGSNQLSFNLTWANSWRNASGEFTDGVWIFAKYAPNGGAQWLHTPVISASATNSFNASIESDSTGTCVRRTVGGQGAASTTVSLTLGNLNGIFPDFKVFGIEMVKIPEGPYYLGGPVTDTGINRLHRGDDDLEAFHVTHSGILTAGSSVNDFGTTASIGYVTDIPAEYPNGYDQFWCMKYEVTQEQYVEFLNTLTHAQQNSRTGTDLNTIDATTQYVMKPDSTPVDRNGIIADLSTAIGGPIEFHCDLNSNGTFDEPDDGQTLVCNWVNDDDFRAYLDWAALRPLTDLEYEKACRGPLPAVIDEHAWGSAAVTQMWEADIVNGGQPNESHALVGSGGPLLKYVARVGLTATNTSDRITSGAGYYGVLGLTGNRTELVHEARFSYTVDFLGTLGDGMLSVTGEHTNADWGISSVGRRGTDDDPDEVMVDLNVSAGNSGPRTHDHGFRGVR